MGLPEALTLAEFMAWEAKQEGKHEFERGRIVPRIVAMARGVTRHSRIANNIGGALFGRLRGSGCGAHNSDQLVYCEETDEAFYPDVTIVCGPPETLRYGTLEAVTNPAVVIEVLSPTTEARDRGHKKEAYATIPSVREIVLVDASKPHVERYVRDERGWRWEATTRLASSVRILEFEIPFDEIYDGVDFEEPLE